MMAESPGLFLDGVGRQGKHLVLYFENDHRLVIHLGMSGQLRYQASDLPLPPHTHMRLVFSHDTGQPAFELRHVDPRRFGWVRWASHPLEKTCPEIAALGPDALEITFGEFEQRFRRLRRQLKVALLDQHILAGLGNIYVDEALFRSRLHPRRRADTLRASQRRRLFEEISAVLREAIAAGGSSISSYVDLEGAVGKFQFGHQAYGQDGKPCPNGCGRHLKREAIAGRSTHFCPKCQR